MDFLHLGYVVNIFAPFVKTSSVDASLIGTPPTLSPKDPNFPAWWEEHKSEWEEAPKKEGQEPADD